MEEHRYPDGASSIDATFLERARALAREPVGGLRRLLVADDLLQHGSIIAAATVASGGLNYAFQVFMGRALGPEQFGVFGALFALFYLGSVLGRGVRFAASRFVAEFEPGDPSLSPFYRGFLARTALFSAVVFVVTAAASPGVAAFLGVDSPRLVLLALTSVPLGLALTANRGTLQGLQWFVPLGGYKVLVAGVKLALGVVLVGAGFGLYGAFGAVVSATALVLVVSSVHLRWRLPPTAESTPDVSFGRAYRYVPPAILAGFCVTVPGTVDVIVVQRFFAEHQAGLYTAVSVLGKVLVFLPLGICAALFPKVSNDHVSAGEGDLGRLLLRGLGYSGAIAGAGALLYLLAPEHVLRLFFGREYAAAAPLLRWYGVAVFAFTLALVLLNFELARDRTRYVYVFTGGSIVEIGLLWIYSDSLVGLAQVILLANAALFAYGLYEVRK